MKSHTTWQCVYVHVNNYMHWMRCCFWINFYMCMTLGLSMPTLWRLVLRNDKYSSKVFKYFVEYSDKESLKKSRIESERHESTGEARPKSFQEPNPISIPHHGSSGFSVTPMPTCILWWSMFFLVWKLRATNIEYSITVQDHYARIFGLYTLIFFLHQAGDVALSKDWIKPTEEPDESQEGGHVQTPAEGET